MPINLLTLAKLAANDPSVVGLSLTQEVESDEDVVKLVHALKGNTHLKSLTIQGYLFGKRITDEGVEVLTARGKSITDKSAELLATCNNLVFLDISYNWNITNIGAAALAKNLSIETLFMRGCRVTPVGLDPFLENEAVTELRIAMTPSPDEQVGEIVKAKLNNNKEFKAKIDLLNLEDLNLELYELIQMNPVCIEKLQIPLQSNARKHPADWDDALTVGLTLAYNLSKLPLKEEDVELRRVVEFFAVYTTIEDLPQKTLEGINLELYRVIQVNKGCIQKLPVPLRSIAAKPPGEWEEDAMTTVMTLSHNFTKLWKEESQPRIVAKFSAIYAKRYRALYEQQKRLMQFPAAPIVEQRKKQKTEKEAAKPVNMWLLVSPKFK